MSRTPKTPPRRAEIPPVAAALDLDLDDPPVAALVAALTPTEAVEAEEPRLEDARPTDEPPVCAPLDLDEPQAEGPLDPIEFPAHGRADKDAFSGLDASERERPEGTPTIPSMLPLVPIRDSVYFPQMLFSLFVGRDRSIRAVEAAMEGRRWLLLASQRSLLAEEPEPEEIYTMGIAAEVTHMVRLPNNTVRVMLEGGPRVRLIDYAQTDPFLLVQVEPIAPPDPESDANTMEALYRTVTLQFETLVTEGKNIPPETLVNVLSVDNPGRLADAIVPHLPLRVDEKQALLETLSARERLERLSAVLHRESEIVEIQKQLRTRVEKEMGDNQREFFLREQLRVIQQELGERDERQSEIDEYREKIETRGMPEETRARALKELDRFERIPAASPESGVLRTYLDWLVAFPWNATTEDTLDLSAAEQVLAEEHFGLEKVKERILEFLAVRQLAGSALKAPILCFVGPPGVGKTSLGRSVARALSRRFVRISLGGLHDEAEIRGHRRTYVGAMPGRIVQAFKQAGVKNPVVVLDEIDKIGRDFRGDPSSALLEALDTEQNREFSDHYMEVPVDLSQALFITTANLLDPIPAALRDRLEVIPFTSYTEEEKLAIAERHLLPRQRAAHGLNEAQLQTNRETLLRVIRDYTREPGVRALEREIAALCRKTARRVASGEAPAATIAAESLPALLGRPRSPSNPSEERDVVGAATGLAFTEAGGETITIEVGLTRSAGESRLLLTGQLGDVMKESAQAALTFVRSRLDLDTAGRDIHLHVPAGGVPKDGPSAGTAITAALASALTGKPVRRDVALTGEITIRGRVLPVGGIKEKVLAAHRAGLRQVILPADNARDLDEIPESVRAALEFTFVAHADEALAQALAEPEPAPARKTPARRRSTGASADE